MSLPNISQIRLFLLVFCLIQPIHTPLYGADLSIPRLELNTWGADKDGTFEMATHAAADISINGGYKFGVFLGFSFDAANLGKALAYRNFDVAFLEPRPKDPPDPLDPDAMDTTVSIEEYNRLVDRMNNQAVLSFRTAKATVREMFDKPIEFSCFAGLGDPFGSGDEFAARFGIYDVATPFTGFYYFPEGIGENPRRRYDGLYSPQGTGLSFVFTQLSNFIPMLYLYHDFATYNGNGNEMLYEEKPRYSGDLRFLFNADFFQMDAYGGVSLSEGEAAEVRGGILAFFKTEKGSEFLLQLGIPGFMVDGEFNVDHIYLLFESRLKFNSWAVHTTFFYHPVEYMHIFEEKERGKADVNIKALVGNPQEAGFRGGVEATAGLKVYDMADYYIKVSPFISYMGNGFQWDFKVRIDPTAFGNSEELKRLIEIFMGVKTAY